MTYPNQVQKYFNDHKISEKVLNDFYVGWNGKQIVYPVFDIEGNKLFYVFRRDPNSEMGPRFVYERGSHVSLYGINKVQKEKTVLITEGLTDCLCAWSQGIPAVTSTGGAISFQKEWKDLLCDKEIIILLDADEAGGKGTARILNILPNAKVVFLPEKKGCKDVSDFIFHGGDLQKLLQTARYFNNLSEVKDDYSDRIALMKPVWFHTAYIENHREKEVIKAPRKKNGDDLARAKSYPIDQLLKFGRDNKICCIFHNETGASMTYYKKENRFFCFGCGKGGDTIDIYMELHHCDFLTAVAALQ